MSYNSVSELFKGICDSIRSKEGSTDIIRHQDIPFRILGLSTAEGETTKTFNYGSFSYENSVEFIMSEYSKNPLIIKHGLDVIPNFIYIWLDELTPPSNYTGKDFIGVIKAPWRKNKYLYRTYNTNGDVNPDTLSNSASYICVADETNISVGTNINIKTLPNATYKWVACYIPE